MTIVTVVPTEYLSSNVADSLLCEYYSAAVYNKQQSTQQTQYVESLLV